MYRSVGYKGGEGSLCPYLKAFLSNSSLPFQAPITVKKKKPSRLVRLGYVSESSLQRGAQAQTVPTGLVCLQRSSR